eukprot:8553704-Pyramimonas_sp.AAC.1
MLDPVARARPACCRLLPAFRFTLSHFSIHPRSLFDATLGCLVLRSVSICARYRHDMFFTRRNIWSRQPQELGEYARRPPAANTNTLPKTIAATNRLRALPPCFCRHEHDI